MMNSQKNHPAENKVTKCKCGKTTHFKKALYCTNCGARLIK